MVQLDEPGPWPFVELAEDDSLKVGDWLVCLGHPGGYEIGRVPPVRAGKVLEFRPTQVITDCALIGGDSGGPLFDLNGRLVAIHSSISDSIAVNRHVTVASFRESWPRMSRGESWGKLPDLAEFEDELAPRAGLGVTVDLQGKGGTILKVRPGSIAEQNGFQVGDVIVKLDDTLIQDPRQVVELISKRSPGDIVRVELERNGQRLKFQLKLDAI
jgi:serine protease Do